MELTIKAKTIDGLIEVISQIKPDLKNGNMNETWLYNGSEVSWNLTGNQGV